MKAEAAAAPPNGIVLSLHAHPADRAMQCVEQSVFHLVAEQGIVEDKRYFGRRNRAGQPSKRQVTLIAREELVEHARALGMDSLGGGTVRSNIETEGVALVAWLGRKVRVGTAVLEFVEPRTPCQRMDDIRQGLRAMMENGRQGIIARVLETGEVRPGDRIELAEPLLA